jgi:putative ubiquitin-RnfH superfamily antitoxin RatB of RatAB toxin-antitoxin module
MATAERLEAAHDAARVAHALEVTAVFSPVAGQVHEHTLQFDAGSTINDALDSLRCRPGFESLQNSDMDTIAVGIWGKTMPLRCVLQHGDRLEIYRPLSVDPKVARRLRFKGQGVKVKSAGLFATRRDGAKAGY